MAAARSKRPERAGELPHSSLILLCEDGFHGSRIGYRPRKERIMKCPNCPDVTLAIAERHGVELDYCPQCRGVWLDRGELDKLIERAAQSQPGTRRQFDDGYDGHGSQHGSQHRSRDNGHRHGSHERRRKSWLADIFD
jgi:hypothetical protein